MTLLRNQELLGAMGMDICRIILAVSIMYNDSMR